MKEGRLIGAHMPTGKGLGAAVRNGKAIGCTAVQVFTSSPRMWKGGAANHAKAEDLSAARNETGIQALISHDTYLVNLCAPSDETRTKSLFTLKEEMTRCSAYGIPLVVSHMGAHMGQGEEEGLQLIAKGAKEVLAETPDDVTLLMETTAGQGSYLNYRFEHLASIFDQTGTPDRLGVCLDTCHLFAAGYDLRTREAYDETIEQLARLVGVERVKAIHVNDSKKGLGSKVDRHDHLGEGLIGIGAFRFLVNDPKWFSTPLILETPDAENMHAVNLERLWGLVE